MTLFYLIYDYLAWPILRLIFLILALFNEKIREGLRMRRRESNGSFPWLKGAPGSRPIWIHCSSGEFEYAKPVIRELKRRKPDVPILVTYFSPTMAKAIAGFTGVDLAAPIPWDTAKALSEFIAFHQPRAFLVARTDLWPEMARQTRAHHIPSLIFSTTLGENSGRRHGLGAWLTRILYSQLTDVYCVSEADRAHFAELGLKAEVCGDTRYDQVIARLQTPKPIKENLFISHTRPIFVAGSTWPEDEAVLLPVAQALQNDIDFVLVPHEPGESHLLELENRISDRGLRSVRYSQITEWPEGQILLVDQVGILAELYQKARFAFVGGSFRKTVHSVMEPLAAGCLTYVGPLHHNNREALEFRTLPSGLRAASTMVTSVENSSEFATRLRLDLAVDSLASIARTRIQDEIQARSGKSAAVVDWTLRHSGI